ncbi:MAG: hypothetical protein JNM37_13410 [Rhodocyclaceae bacterium]|nr:hypothetical protein [Rhodocyclaceae bacterium]
METFRMNSSHSPALSDTEEADTQKPSPRRYVVLLAALLSVLAAAYYTFFVNPLASDEEMIAHFNAHRAEIEALVKSYREWEPTPGENVIWNHKPETKRLLERAGVWAVSDIAPIWFDDPYSIEGAARFDVLLRAGTPQGYFRKIGTIEVLLLGKEYARSSFFRYPKGAGLFKRFVYYPVRPRVENGLLLHPFHFGRQGEGDRVFDSLNAFPPDWKVGECVLRKLEPQWFIQMCRAT